MLPADIAADATVTNGKDANFAVDGSRTIGGATRKQDRARLPGATVVLKLVNNDKIATTTSDKDGGFTFTNLSPGKYKVKSTTAPTKTYGLDDETVDVSTGDVHDVKLTVMTTKPLVAHDDKPPLDSDNMPLAQRRG